MFASLRAARGDVRFHCIGGDVPAEVQALAASDGVQIHGHVPDLQPWLAGCLAAVAPMRYGAGVKGKVNQAMAHGLPVVATTPAAEGMHLVDGRDVLVADAAEAFATAVLRQRGAAFLDGRRARRGARAVPALSRGRGVPLPAARAVADAWLRSRVRAFAGAVAVAQPRRADSTPAIASSRPSNSPSWP